MRWLPCKNNSSSFFVSGIRSRSVNRHSATNRARSSVDAQPRAVEAQHLRPRPTDELPARAPSSGLIIRRRVLDHPAHWTLAIASLSLCVSTGCAPEEEPLYRADAEVYAEAYCGELCRKYDACAPVPESVGVCYVEECVDELLAEFDAPCTELNTEVVRCRVQRESCEEFFDLVIDTTPASVCYDQVLASDTCFQQHNNDG